MTLNADIEYSSKDTVAAKSLPIKLLDHIFFLRPLLILPIWAPSLLGYWAAGGRGFDFTFISLLFFGIALGGGIYGLNQIYDIRGDRLNAKNLNLALGTVSLRAAWIITALCYFLTLAISLYIGWITAIFAVVGLALGIAYSHPKFKLKDKPLPALIANAFGHGSLVYLTGYSSLGILRWEALLRMLPYALAYGGVYLATTIPDLRGDSLVGKKTLSVIWGEKKTSIVAFALILSGAISGISLKEPALFLTGLFALPFYINALTKGGRNFVTANKVAVLLLNLWICFYIFPYIVLLAVVVAGSRLYYTKRLGVRYP